MNEIRFAFRNLLLNPRFAVLAVITLAIGIGATSAMFSLIEGALLSTPYARPERIVLVSPQRTDGRPYNAECTVGQWMEWRQATKSFEEWALYGWTFNYLILPEGSESAGGMWVTKNYFKVLGLKPALGREFMDAEFGRGNAGPRAIILGYDLWQRRFQGDRSILGKTVRISRMEPLEVVGVMPAGVRFLPDSSNASEPNYDMNARVDYWLPVAPDETKLNDGTGYPCPCP
jgi:putative ABC transport system permease protein